MQVIDLKLVHIDLNKTKQTITHDSAPTNLSNQSGIRAKWINEKKKKNVCKTKRKETTIHMLFFTISNLKSAMTTISVFA